VDGNAFTQWECPQCGYVEESTNDNDLPPAALYRPWHVRSRKDIWEYVNTLGLEVREWLLALYVDKDLNLISVETVARGTVSDCAVPSWKLISRGHQVEAAGFFLVHNHPSGDPRPSRLDMMATSRLRYASSQLDMPLLDHFVITSTEMRGVGVWPGDLAPPLSR
jgi:DNA repair protein RadC